MVSQEIFENNLTCLEKRYPEYAARLRTMNPFPSHPSDPAPVQSWLKQIVKPQPRQVVLLGLAGGIPVQVLCRDYGLHTLVILECHYEHFARAMHHVDLRESFTDETVHWLIGCPPSQLEQGLRLVKTILAAHGFQVIRAPIASPNEKTYYDAVLNELSAAIERETFSLKALLARGTGVQANLARNFPIILDSYPLDSVVKKFSQRPAIVVAAGPSLDRNVPLLKTLDDRALLLCVDTAAKTLLPMGIHPHMIVTSDPTPENARHFDNVVIPNETVLAFAPDGCPDILIQYRNHPRKLCLLDDSNWLNEHLRQMLSLRYLLPRPMHVGETAIRLAIAMGCDPIIFVGLDLALPRDAKATHARASARALPILSMENNQAQVRNETGGIHTQNLVPVPGIDGQPVFTYYSFKMYLADLENLIAKTPVRWIDATEGGALKRGSHIQTLEHTLSQLGEPIPVEEALLHLTKPPREILNSCLTILRQRLLRLETLETELGRVAAGETGVEKASQIWEIFLNDKEIRALMDHAIFPFQLYPRLHKITVEEKADFLRVRAREAVQIVRMFQVFWKDALRERNEKDER